MTTKKAILLGCGGAGLLLLLCGGVIGLIVYFVIAMTAPAVDGANKFLALLGEGKTADAYALTASGLKSQQTEAEFTAMVKKIGLTEYKADSATFWKRNVVNQTAELAGTITTKDGSSIPIAMKLVQENGAWVVLSVTGEGGVAVAEAEPQVPAEPELRKLVKTTLLDFNDAVQKKDFGDFYKQTAALWQREATPEKLQANFQQFIDKEVNVAFIGDHDPVFATPPVIGKNDFLELKGYYPTKPTQVHFDLKYAYEHPAWKVVGIKVEIKAPEGAAQPKPPTNEEARLLVKTTLMDFNASVQKKDFTEFHANMATAFQKENTPEKLQAVFQAFIDNKVNIAPIADLEPVFDPPPAVGKNGLLGLNGRYPTKPNVVHFKLAYAHEDSAWKLVGINVQIKEPEGSEQPKAPTEEEAHLLVRTTLLDVNTAVQRKDFAEFHRKIAELWRKEATPEKLQAIFQSFIDKGVTLAGIAELDPVFASPLEVKRNGLLQIKGHYPTKPNQVHFDLTYAVEETSWKLVGIAVDVQEPSKPKVPAEAELKQLAKTALSDLNVALQKKDFTDFYKKTAKLWQKETTPEKLREVFQPFIDGGVNIAAIDRQEPVFDPPPAIGANNLLELKGHYPTKPKRVLFGLKFISEEASWKLVTIGIELQD